MTERPRLYVVSGPNGAGKSTLAQLLLPDASANRPGRTSASGAPSPRPRPAIREHYSDVRRKSCALRATITVLADIRMAPTAGWSTMPHGASTPAASGIAAML